VNHSQNNLMMMSTTNINMLEDEINAGGRQRSDSMETDRGNPMENMPPMTNLDTHLEMLGTDGFAVIDGFETNNRSFESPPGLNHTKTSFKNIGGIVERPAPIYEEVKDLVGIQNIREGTSE